jgi:hypothetical protein
MDMNNGVRTVLATNQQPSEQLVGPKLVALDLANGRAFRWRA